MKARRWRVAAVGRRPSGVARGAAYRLLYVLRRPFRWALTLQLVLHSRDIDIDRGKTVGPVAAAHRNVPIANVCPIDGFRPVRHDRPFLARFLVLLERKPAGLRTTGLLTDFKEETLR